MKIIHLATTNAGGAGIAATRIHNLLLEMGHNSHLYVQHKELDSEKTTEVQNKGGQGKKYMVKMRLERKLAKMIDKTKDTDWKRFRKDDVYCYNDYDEENCFCHRKCGQGKGNSYDSRGSWNGGPINERGWNSSGY